MRALAGCSFVDEEVMSDVYYDTGSYTLSMIDHWLRSRNNSWYTLRPHSPAHCHALHPIQRQPLSALTPLVADVLLLV